MPNHQGNDSANSCDNDIGDVHNHLDNDNANSPGNDFGDVHNPLVHTDSLIPDDIPSTSTIDSGCRGPC